MMKLQILGLSFLCACASVSASTVPAATTIPACDAVPEVKKEAPEAPKKKELQMPESVEVSSSIVVPTPLFADVKNLQDKTFDADAKLRTVIPAPGKLAYSVVKKDEKNFFVAPSEISESVPAKADTLTLFRTFITPKAFTRGKLFVSSPQKLEVWVDGKKVADKLGVDADVSKHGTATAHLKMEVDRAEVWVKVLTQKDSKLPPMVKVEFEAEKEDVPAVAFSDGKEKRPVTIADVNEVDRIGGLALSPDGKYIMITYSYLRDDGSFSRKMEVRETATGKTLWADDMSRTYAWMPNGSRLYFRRSEPGDLCSYVAYDFKTGEETVLAENLPNSNYSYKWLPDESGLIVTKTEKWSKESSDWKRVLNMADRSDGWRDRSFLYRYDLKKGIFEPLTAGAKSTKLLGISPDSQKILFATSDIDYSQPEFSTYNVYELDLKTLENSTIFENEKYGPAFCGWSPDGKKMLFLAGPDAFGGIGSVLPEGVRANSFDTQAFLYDTGTKKLEPITREFDPAIDSGVWGGDGNIYFSTADRDMENIYRYVPATKKFEKISVPANIVSAFNVQENPADFASVAYALGSDSTAFPKVYKVDLSKNVSTVFVDNSSKVENELAFPEVKQWTFTASDGTTIDGHYFLPADFDPTKKYPMIVYYYSGTTPTSRVLGAHYPFPLYTAQGYVVYVVNPSGTIGYGQEFSARHLNAWGKRTADDIIEGVKQFCAEHDFVNPKKIGCIGASYGGFMTMYLQTRTDIFSAAVAHAGISDITSYWGEGMWGYSYNAIAAAGSFPWKDKDIYIEQSPLFSADKINTPILLCHGIVDKNVPVGESVQMFTALKLLGKPVELLTFTGEDHGIMNYNRRKQWIKSHLAWFARWLKDDGDWWNTLYPEKNW
ncbi:MAG: S9 family peptidase [Opitutales bacterium]|nr:S9 family peptidase [Opitutales bacterium]